jgi:glycosyltransferase involved in cell wall biosynthesis
MNQKKHIFFTTSGLFTFVKKDLDFLEKHYHVNVFVFSTTKKWQTPFLFIKQAILIIVNIFKTDIYICKFPGYLSFLPCIFSKLTKKPCLLITAGTESAGIPSIHYGNFDRKLLGKFTEFSFRWATHIAPVHKSLMLQDYIYHKEIHPQQGAAYFCKNLKTPYTEINYGFNPDQWVYGNEMRNTNSVAIIAAGFENKVVFLRKGLDLIFEIADKLTEFTFTIIGCDNEALSMKVPSNVLLMKKITQDELIKQFQKHEFYAQLSMFEGFPNALCEAMLCGCIPIGSSVSAIPDIIKDTGFILKEKNVSDLISLFKSTANYDKKKLSLAARHKIKVDYHFLIREQKLKTLIDSLIQ